MLSVFWFLKISTNQDEDTKILVSDWLFQFVLFLSTFSRITRNRLCKKNDTANQKREFLYLSSDWLDLKKTEKIDHELMRPGISQDYEINGTNQTVKSEIRMILQFHLSRPTLHLLNLR
jgi:hypothetical protein